MTDKIVRSGKLTTVGYPAILSLVTGTSGMSEEMLGLMIHGQAREPPYFRKEYSSRVRWVQAGPDT